MSRIGTAYATALLELARETGSEAGVGDELDAVARALAADRRAASLIGSRHMGKEARRRIMERAVGEGADERVRAALGILASRGKLRFLGDVASEYRRLRAVAGEVRRVTLRTATELEPAQRERARRTLERRLGARVELDVVVDPGLIAGARIEAGGLEYDMSVQRMLRDLAERLARRGA